MPPKAEIGQVLGIALCSAKAVLGGRSGDVSNFKTLLQSWSTSLPLLEELTEQLSDPRTTHGAAITTGRC